MQSQEQPLSIAECDPDSKKKGFRGLTRVGHMQGKYPMLHTVAQVPLSSSLLLLNYYSSCATLHFSVFILIFALSFDSALASICLLALC